MARRQPQRHPPRKPPPLNLLQSPPLNSRHHPPPPQPSPHPLHPHPPHPLPPTPDPAAAAPTKQNSCPTSPKKNSLTNWCQFTLLARMSVTRRSYLHFINCIISYGIRRRRNQLMSLFWGYCLLRWRMQYIVI